MTTDTLGQLRFGRLLVAIDGSENATLALDAAVTAAKRDNAALTLVGVAPDVQAEANRWPLGPQLPPDVQDEADAQTQKLLNETVEAIPDDIPVTKILRRGRAGAEIVAVAEEGEYDAILVGARGLGRVASLVGSVSGYVLHHAKTAVFVAHAPKGEDAPG